jgi:hypothetical protein
VAANGRKLKINHEGIRDHLFDRTHHTGQEVTNDLPNFLREAIRHESWKHFRQKTGEPFADVGEWLRYPWPGGVSVDGDRHTISYEQLIALCKDHPDVEQVLREHAPNRGRGRPKKEEGEMDEKVPRETFSRQGTRKEVLAVRLAQEKPDHYAAYVRGEYRSVRAAAEAAGLVPPGHDPLARLRSYWRKASAAARQEFLAWIKEQES